MVGTMLKSALREIRQSLGRYLAILAIVGLGVGFFSGLRTSQPAMMATGIDYLEEQRLYDFRLLSTLGFPEEDVAGFAGGGAHTVFERGLADRGRGPRGADGAGHAEGAEPLSPPQCQPQ